MPHITKSVVELFAVALLYFALAQVGFMFALPGANITLLWLPSGLAMTAVVVLGYRAGLGVLAGAFLANYVVLGAEAAATPWPVALAVAFGNAVEAVFAGALFARFIGRASQQINVGQVLRLLVIAMLATLPGALWGAWQLTAAAPEQALLQGLLVWWAGDTLGIIVGFPVLYFLYSRYLQGSEPTVFARQMGVLALGVLLSTVLYLYALNLQRESLQLRFRYVAEVAFLSMELAIEQIFQHQSQLADDIAQQIPPDREFFSSRVQAELAGPYRTRGLFGLSWNPVVTAAQRAQVEALARQQGYADFSILERDAQGELQVAAEHPLHVVVFHIEPMASNAGALGFDIYSDPSRRVSIDEAIRRNTPVLTPPVALVQSQGEGSAPGALLLWPVQTDAAGTQELPAGFVVAVIRYDDLLAQTSMNLISDAVVSMFDVTESTSSSRVFTNDPEAALEQPQELSRERPFLMSKVLDVGGRQLQVFAEPRAQFLAQNQSFTPLIVLLVSLLMSVLATLVYVQRTRTEQARAQMLYRTSQIINSTPDAMVAMNAQGRVTEWNEAAVELFGYPVHEAIGRSLGELIVPQSSQQAHEQAMRKRVPGNPSAVINHTIEVQARRANGEVFPAELAVKEVSIHGVLEYIGLMRDLSERKLFEEKRSEAQKLEAIGQLTGGLAHDFNNLLGIVIANLDYLDLHKLRADDASHARNALDAALRASRVTRSLMAVARRQTLETRSAELNSQLGELAPLMATTVSKHVRLETQLSRSPLWVSMDKTGFTNVIINLLINARDALQGCSDSCVVVSTAEVTLKEGELDLPAGDYARVSVRDNGSGIPEQVLKHVFEPFFTTKERGHGTGLGLPMVYGFARQLNGTVQIESEEGKGTTVSLYLPILASHDLEVEARAEAPAPDIPARALRVLLVDDEEFLRRIAVRMVTDMGFSVLEAASGEEAQALLRRESVDILLTDIAMPGALDGVQLATWVAHHQPHVHIILTTGYLDESRRDAIAPHWQILEKPYRREDLSRVLRAI